MISSFSSRTNIIRKVGSTKFVLSLSIYEDKNLGVAILTTYLESSFASSTNMSTSPSFLSLGSSVISVKLLMCLKLMFIIYFLYDCGLNRVL